MTFKLISETVLKVHFAPSLAKEVEIMLPEVIPSASKWLIIEISSPFSTTAEIFSEKSFRS
jgi:hypothetical protein